MTNKLEIVEDLYDFYNKEASSSPAVSILKEEQLLKIVYKLYNIKDKKTQQEMLTSLIMCSPGDLNKFVGFIGKDKYHSIVGVA